MVDKCVFEVETDMAEYGTMCGLSDVWITCDKEKCPIYQIWVKLEMLNDDYFMTGRD